MKKAFYVFLWFTALMIVWTIAGKLMSAPNDLSLIVGIIIWILFIYVTYIILMKKSKK